MAIINSGHLLQQADRLLKPRSNKLTVIRQAERRRAISTAYYAVFHHVLRSVADQFVGPGERRTPLYALAYRSVDHGKLETLCNAVGRENVNPKGKYTAFFPEGGFNIVLREYAALLIDLKEKRNLADYDPSHRVRIVDARNSIAAAREAIEKFGDAPENEKEIFLALLIFPPR